MSAAGEKILRSIRSLRSELQEGKRPVTHVPADVDVRAIRQGLELSQSAFAARFGFTVDAVRNWEQGRRRPEGPARVLLKVIEREPQAVTRALEDA